MNLIKHTVLELVAVLEELCIYEFGLLNSKFFLISPKEYEVEWLKQISPSEWVSDDDSDCN